MPVIDLALIGVPKSGTSSLYAWLDAHPQLQGSRPKETFFLMDQGHPLRTKAEARGLAKFNDVGLSGYKCFFPEPPKGRLRFEATPHYYYQQTARDALASLEPKPLIVFILRQPAERLYSSFRYTQENLSVIERSLSFPDYVDFLLGGRMEEARGFYRSEVSFYVAARELELGQYAHWLRLWVEAFGRERIEILLFDELRSDPMAVLQRLCKRLGLEALVFEGMEPSPMNRTLSVRSQSAHRLAQRLGSRVSAGVAKRLLKKIYSTLQNDAKSLSPSDADHDALRRLDAYFEPSNLELSTRFDLDLGPWSLCR